MRAAGAFAMAESIVEFFLEHFRARRHERACRQRRGYRMESFTYGQILDLATGFARMLEARGIIKGERVMLWGENSAQWIASFFGCVLAGVIVVPIDDASAADFAVRVSRQVEARLLVASRRHLHECSVAGFPIATVTLEHLAEAERKYDEEQPRGKPRIRLRIFRARNAAARQRRRR